MDTDFWSHYSLLCEQCKFCPLKRIMKNCKSTELVSPVEVIRNYHWPLVAEALASDISLTKIHFSTNLPPLAELTELWKKEKRRYPLPYAIQPANISVMCLSLQNLLQVNNVLTVLKLENLSLANEDAVCLGKGLSVSTVKHFSVAGCQINSAAVKSLCISLYPCDVEWVDFSACNLSCEDVEEVCSIIRAHKMRRNLEVFPQTLRCDSFSLDDVRGLNRLSLSGNVITKPSVEFISLCLDDDRWVKALDLQACALSEPLMTMLLTHLKDNKSIEWIDMRLNADCDSAVVMCLNNKDTPKYNIGPLFKVETKSKKAPKRKTFKTQVKKFFPSRTKIARKDLKSLENAIRISCSLLDGHGVGMTSPLGTDVGCQTEPSLIQHMKKISRSLTQEATMRHIVVQLLKKIKNENSVLRKELQKVQQGDCVFIDNKTFEDVRETLLRFNNFLGVFKQYNLWNYIDLLGINENAELLIESPPDSSETNLRVVDRTTGELTALCDRAAKVDNVAMTTTSCCGCKCYHRCQKPPEGGPPISKESLGPKPQRPKNGNVSKCFREAQETYLAGQGGNGKTPQCSRIGPTKLRFKNAKQIFDVVKEDFHCSLEPPDSEKFASNPGTSKNTGVSSKSGPCTLKASVTVSSKQGTPKGSISAISNVCPSHCVVVPAKGSRGSSKCSVTVKTTLCTKPCGSTSPGTSKSGAPSNSNPGSLKSGVPSNSNPGSLKSGASSSSNSGSLKSSIHMHSSISSSEKPLSAIEHAELDAMERSILKSILSGESLAEVAGGKYSQSPAINALKKKLESLKGSPVEKEIISTFLTKRNMKYAPESGDKGQDLKNAQQKSKSENHTDSSITSNSKSYLESVADASTDNDVKTLTASEVASEVVKSSSKASSKSSKSKSKRGNNSNNASVPKLPEGGVVKSSGKKKSVSDTSLPSLSDITTVSSRSLNTNSVMGQLSEG